MSELKEKAIGGVFWTGLETVGQYFIQLIITIVLARILTPKDFGTVEMLLIFTALSNIILDSGFSQALIRKKEVSQADLSSVFYFNITMGAGIYAILFFLAPYIAAFYKTPELVTIARVIFLGIIINAFGIIHITMITSRLKFKLLTRSSISGALVSAILGIALAMNGFGVWALVFQALSFTFSKTIMLWLSYRWKPDLVFQLSAISSLFGFSSKLLIVGLMDVIFNNIQSLLIGRLYSKTQLGFYSQAKKIQSVPSNSLTLIIQKVTYPILSKIQDEDQRLKVNYKKIIQIAVFFVGPLMLFLLAVGDRLFMVLLTEKWMPAVRYFQPLCLVGAMFPLYSINLNIITAKGAGSLFLKVGIIKRLVVLAAILTTVNFGVIYIVWGQVAATLVNSIITMYYSGKLINYDLKEQLTDILPIYLIAGISVSFIYLIGISIDGNDSWVLVLQAITMVAIYYGISKISKSGTLKELSLIFSYVLLKAKIKKAPAK